MSTLGAFSQQLRTAAVAAAQIRAASDHRDEGSNSNSARPSLFSHASSGWNGEYWSQVLQIPINGLLRLEVYTPFSRQTDHGEWSSFQNETFSANFFDTLKETRIFQDLLKGKKAETLYYVTRCCVQEVVAPYTRPSLYSFK